MAERGMGSGIFESVGGLVEYVREMWGVRNSRLRMGMVDLGGVTKREFLRIYMNEKWTGGCFDVHSPRLLAGVLIQKSSMVTCSSYCTLLKVHGTALGTSVVYLHNTESHNRVEHSTLPSLRTDSIPVSPSSTNDKI